MFSLQTFEWSVGWLVASVVAVAVTLAAPSVTSLTVSAVAGLVTGIALVAWKRWAHELVRTPRGHIGRCAAAYAGVIIFGITALPGIASSVFGMLLFAPVGLASAGLLVGDALAVLTIATQD